MIHGFSCMDWGVRPKNGAVTNPSEIRVEVNRRGRLYVEQLMMTAWCMLTLRGEYLRVDAVDDVTSWATSGQHDTHEHFGVIGTREGLYVEGRAKHPGNHRKCVGSHSSTEVLPLNGVYVGAGNSPVPNKVAERIRRWEFVDMAELLPEVRLSGGENEGRLLQRKPRCVTDIITWIQGICVGAWSSLPYCYS